MSGRETDSDVAYQSRLYGICETASSGQVGAQAAATHGVLQPVGEADPGRSQTPKATSPEISTLRLGV